MAKNLTAFLAQNAKKIDNVTFIASDRFVDPDTGEAMPREICCITAAENAGLRKACNLNDAELQQSYGVMGAEQLITTMLTPAEFEDYSTKVLQVNGFQSGDEMVEEAKN